MKFIIVILLLNIAFMAKYTQVSSPYERVAVTQPHSTSNHK